MASNDEELFLENNINELASSLDTYEPPCINVEDLDFLGACSLPIKTEPEEPKLSRAEKKIFQCRICGHPANDHNHYGLLYCCFPCKAFFRRSIRSGLDHPPCENGGNCQITMANRTQCPACRYQKCLKKGMDPKLVMSQADLEEKRRKREWKLRAKGITRDKRKVKMMDSEELRYAFSHDFFGFLVNKEPVN